jgi:hypothetical protein
VRLHAGVQTDVTSQRAVYDSQRVSGRRRK